MKLEISKKVRNPHLCPFCFTPLLKICQTDLEHKSIKVEFYYCPGCKRWYR